MRGIRQHQLKIAVGEDMPNRFPVDTRRFHGNVRALGLGQPLRQRQEARRGRCKRAGLLDDFAIDHEAYTGDHRRLVNVETATARMQDFHNGPPDTPPAWGSQHENSRDRAPGRMTARGDRLRCGSGYCLFMTPYSAVARCSAALFTTARVTNIKNWYLDRILPPE